MAMYKADYPAGSNTICEHDPVILEGVLADLISRIIRDNSIAEHGLKGISICGHGPSVVFIDAGGKPLSKIITWQDKRAEQEAGYLRENYRDFSRDGTSYEAKILWFFRNRPDLFKSGNTVLYPKDYILFKLTGNRIIDRSAASTTLFYNVDSKTWVPDQPDLPIDILPAVVNSWEQIGETGGAFSRGCNLSSGIPVFAGGIDAYCEAVGAGAVEPGYLVDGTGTSTCISKCCSVRAGLDLHVIPARSLKIEMMSASGLSVDWILALFSESLDFLETLDPDTPAKLLFLPYLVGERSPHWDEKARGAFIGLTVNTDRNEAVKAVLQGVAFGIKENLLRLGQGSNREDESVRAVGGGANSRVWLQLKANVTGKIYKKMKVIDSAALGALILAALGNREGEPAELVNTWVKVEECYYPDKKAAYETLFKIYSRSYPDLQGIFDRLYAIN